MNKLQEPSKNIKTVYTRGEKGALKRYVGQHQNQKLNPGKIHNNSILVS